MSFWTWVLVGLCCAGVLLVLVSLVLLALAALAVVHRLMALARNPLLDDLESLEMQTRRLQAAGERTAPLMQRATAAVESLRESARALGLPYARLALRVATTGVAALLAELR